MSHNAPIVRDFAFITSSVKFPTADNNQVETSPDHHRQRTRSNSSSSSSSRSGLRRPRPSRTSLSRRGRKELSPVAEEFEGGIRDRLPPPTSSRLIPCPYKPGSTTDVAPTGKLAEELTVAFLRLGSHPPLSEEVTTRRRAMGKTRSKFLSLRLSIRARLSAVRFRNLGKRS